MRQSAGWHGVAAVSMFSALALWMMFPVLVGAETALAGTHLGDNAAGLWNVWWFRHATEHAQPLFRTPMLFAPFGTQLSLHTHATTHSLLAWPLTAFTPVVVAHNLAITAGLALNGICAWLLAFRATGRFLPSTVAGVLFSCSAFTQVHLLGHVNLLHAWVLPLFVLALIRFTSQPGVPGALAAGLSAAMVVYTDYYFAVYAGAFVLIWIAGLTMRRGVTRMPGRLTRVRSALLVLIIVDVLLIVMIATTGGTTMELGFASVSLRGVRNPLTVFWLLLAGWTLCRYPFRLSVRWGIQRPSRRVLALGAAAAVVWVVATAPLWLALLRVVAAGDYTTQRVLWRSSPPGVDALTLVLGHPRHLFSGDWTTTAYDALGIDVMEQSLWLGIVPLVLIAARRKAWSSVPGARFWAVIGVLFALLAAGPFLRVGGVDVGLPLPQAFLRYLPGFSNARIPGRAAVMVHLSIAMLSAFALVAGRPRAWATTGLAILLMAETLPAPAPVQPVPTPDEVDAALKDSPTRGAVVELPFGIRDGFGEAGHLDHRALVHQIWHERPLAGGFVARLPERVRQQYSEIPLFRDLLAISTPATSEVQLGPEAGARAAELGLGFLVVNRDTFIGDRLPRASLERAGFDLVRTAGPRELYSIGPPNRQP